MSRRKWIWAALLALPAAVGGLVYGKAVARDDRPKAGGYVCPITGEELPCPDCCPLNRGK
jgi:hypothetical protein